MGKIIFFCLICMISLASCKFFKESTFQTEEGFALTNDKIENIADGYSQTEIKFKITSKSDNESLFIDQNKRKVSLTTQIGDFIVDGKPVKSIDVLTDENGDGKTFLQAPKTTGEGFLTVSTIDNLYTRRIYVKFTPSYPDSIYIETPKTILKDSSVTTITTYLLKNKGNVSDNLKLVYQILKTNNTPLEKASFNTISISNNIGKANLVLEKVPIGSYTLMVGIVNEDGKLINNYKGNTKKIEVK